MIKKKKTSKVLKVIFLNLIFLFFILYYLFESKTNRGEDLVGAYFFIFGFLTLLYSITFIHLFCYKKLKEKILIASGDLSPIIFLTIITGIVWFTNLKIEILGGLKSIFFLYLLAGGGIIAFNYILHILFIKFFPFLKKEISS